MPYLDNAKSQPEGDSGDSPHESPNGAADSLLSSALSKGQAAQLLRQQRFPISPSILEFVSRYEAEAAAFRSDESTGLRAQFAGKRVMVIFEYALFLWENRHALVGAVPALKRLDLAGQDSDVMEHLLCADPAETGRRFLTSGDLVTRSTEYGHCRGILFRDFYPNMTHKFPEIDFDRLNFEVASKSPRCRCSDAVVNALYDRVMAVEGSDREPLASHTASHYQKVLVDFVAFAWSSRAEVDWRAAVTESGNAELDPGPFLDRALGEHPEELIEDFLAQCSEGNERQSAKSVLLSVAYKTLAASGLTTLNLERYLFFTPTEGAPQTLLCHEIWGHFYDRSSPEADEAKVGGSKLSRAVARDYGVAWNKYQDFLWKEYGAEQLKRQEPTDSDPVERRRSADRILRELTLRDPELRIEAYLESLPTDRARQMAKSVIVTNAYRYLARAHGETLDVDAFDFRPRRQGVLVSETVAQFYRYLYRRTLPPAEGEIPSEKRYTNLVARNIGTALSRFLSELRERKVDERIKAFQGTPREQFDERCKILDIAIRELTRDDVVGHIAGLKPHEVPGAGTAIWGVFLPWLERNGKIDARLERHLDKPAKAPATETKQKKDRAARATDNQTPSAKSPLDTATEQPDDARHKLTTAESRESPAPTGDAARISPPLDTPETHPAPAQVNEETSAPVRKEEQPQPRNPWEEFSTPLLETLRSRVGISNADPSRQLGIPVPVALEWTERYFHFLSAQPGTPKSPEQVDQAAVASPEPQMRAFLETVPARSRSVARSALLDFVYPVLTAEFGSNFDPSLTETFSPPSGPVLPEIRDFWKRLEVESRDSRNSQGYVKLRGVFSNHFFDDAWQEALRSTAPQPGEDQSQLNKRRLERYRTVAISDPAPVLDSSLVKLTPQDRSIAVGALQRCFFRPLLADGSTAFDIDLYVFHPAPYGTPRISEMRGYYDQLAKQFIAAKARTDAALATRLEHERDLVRQVERFVCEKIIPAKTPPRDMETRLRTALLNDGRTTLRSFLNTVAPNRREAAEATLTLGLFQYLHDAAGSTFPAQERYFSGPHFSTWPSVVQQFCRSQYQSWLARSEKAVDDQEWKSSQARVTALARYMGWLANPATREAVPDQWAAPKSRVWSQPEQIFMLADYPEAKVGQFLRTLSRREVHAMASLASEVYPSLATQYGFAFDSSLIAIARASSAPQTKASREWLERLSAEIPADPNPRTLRPLLDRVDCGTPFFESLLRTAAQNEHPEQGFIEARANEQQCIEQAVANYSGAQLDLYLQSRPEDRRESERKTLLQDVFCPRFAQGTSSLDPTLYPYHPRSLSGIRSIEFVDGYNSVANKIIDGERSGNLFLVRVSKDRMLDLERFEHALAKRVAANLGSVAFTPSDISDALRREGAKAFGDFIKSSPDKDRSRAAVSVAVHLFVPLRERGAINFDPIAVAFRGPVPNEPSELVEQFWSYTLQQFRGRTDAIPGDQDWKELQHQGQIAEDFADWVLKQEAALHPQTHPTAQDRNLSLAYLICNHGEARVAKFADSGLLSRDKVRGVLSNHFYPWVTTLYPTTFDHRLLGFSTVAASPSTDHTIAAWVSLHSRSRAADSTGRRNAVFQARGKYLNFFLDQQYASALRREPIMAQDLSPNDRLRLDRQRLDQAILASTREDVEAFLTVVPDHDRAGARSTLYWDLFDPLRDTQDLKFDPRVEIFVPSPGEMLRVPILRDYYRAIPERHPPVCSDGTFILSQSGAPLVLWVHRFEKFLWEECSKARSDCWSGTPPARLDQKLQQALLGAPGPFLQKFISTVDRKDRATAQTILTDELYPWLRAAGATAFTGVEEATLPEGRSGSTPSPKAGSAARQGSTQRGVNSSGGDESDSASPDQEKPRRAPQRSRTTESPSQPPPLSTAGPILESSLPAKPELPVADVSPARPPLPPIDYGPLFQSECDAIGLDPKELRFPLPEEIVEYLKTVRALLKEEAESRDSLGGADGVSIILNFCEHYWATSARIEPFAEGSTDIDRRSRLSEHMRVLLATDLAGPIKSSLAEIDTSNESYTLIRNSLIDFAVALNPERMEYLTYYICNDTPHHEVLSKLYEMYASRTAALELPRGLVLPALTPEQRGLYCSIVSDYLVFARESRTARSRLDSALLVSSITERPGNLISDFCVGNTARKVVLGDMYFWLRANGHTSYLPMRREEFPAEAWSSEIPDDTEPADETPLAIEPDVATLPSALQLARDNTIVSLSRRLYVSLAPLSELMLADVDLEADAIQVPSENLGSYRRVAIGVHSRRLLHDYIKQVLDTPVVGALFENAPGDTPFFFDIRGGKLIPMLSSEVQRLQERADDEPGLEQPEL